MLRSICVGSTMFLASACATTRAPGVLVDVRIGDPIEVRLNGEGPFRFGFDTGQLIPALISPAVAARVKLPVFQRVDASDGTSSRKVDIVRVDSIQVGDESFEGELALVMQPSDSARDGALGFPLFTQFLIEYDYPAGHLRVHRGALPAPDGHTILPFTFGQGVPVVSMDIAGKEVRALFDTGSAGGLLVPLEMASGLPLESPPQKSGKMNTLFGEFELSSARLRGTVKIGDVTIVNPVITFSDHFKEVNVGKGILSKFRVTFDPANLRLSLIP